MTFVWGMIVGVFCGWFGMGLAWYTHSRRSR
jgi:hypothetical protein